MEWGYVPEAGRNGIILSYTVSYQESSDGIRQTKEVNAPTRQVTLLRLKECTTYNIEVSAATSKWHTHERYMVQVVFFVRNCSCLFSTFPYDSTYGLI